MSERLKHDVAWAAATYLAQEWRPLLPSESDRARFFTQQYEAIKNAIAYYELNREHQERRLLGAGRN
jgi:hypothetical protein